MPDQGRRSVRLLLALAAAAGLLLLALLAGLIAVCGPKPRPATSPVVHVTVSPSPTFRPPTLIVTPPPTSIPHPPPTPPDGIDGKG